MKKKILRSALLTTLGTALLFTLLVAFLLLHLFTERTLQELKQDVKQLCVSLNRDSDPIQQLADLYGNGYSARLTLVAPDGNVLYDSASDSAAMDNHLAREEIREAFETGYGESARYSPTLSQRTYYTAALLDSGLCLRISETRDSVLSMFAGVLHYFIPALLSICVIAAAVAILLTRRIVEPINALNLDTPERNSIYPELEPLLARMTAQNRSIQEYISALDARRNEFETITAGMADGLILMNPQGEILLMNRSACRIFHTEDAKGKRILEISSDETFTRCFTAALQGRRIGELFKADGRIYRLVVNPVYDSGHFSGLFALIPDITDQYLAEQNRREFTANISHELKTPLTSISGYAEIMLSGIAPQEDWPGFVESIHSESTRMIRLVEDILHLSRLDSGALYADSETFDLAGLAREIAQRFEAPAAKRNVRIHVEGESVSITASRRMMDEILSNLIDNAVKYNRNGGSVQVCVDTERSKIRLCVQDSGIGISPEHRDRIFDRFYRVDKSRSKATGGTGLGLSIVKHAVQRLGGTIQLDSTPGEGTTITVLLPGETA